MDTCSAGKSEHTHTHTQHLGTHTYMVMNSRHKTKNISVRCTKEKQKCTTVTENDHFTVLNAWLRKTLSQTEFHLVLDFEMLSFCTHLYIVVILIKSIIAK